MAPWVTFPGSILDLTLPEPYGLPLSLWASSVPFLMLLVPSVLHSRL